MRHATVAAAVLSLMACGPEGFAQLRVTERGVNELSHTIAVRFEGGAARLKVKRVLRNDSALARSYEHHGIALPDGAIATSLRIGRGAELPTACSLSKQEDVAERWALLTSTGDAAPAPIGRLEWSDDARLDLDLFGLLPSETVTVEYDVEVAPRYEAGVLLFDVPHDSVTTPQFEGAAVEETVDGFVVRRQHHTDAVADVRWATSQLDTNRTLWRFEVDAAPELSRVPVAPRVVFVIDASHSEGPKGIAAQLEVMAPYLANVPDAQVEVVLTRRFAERLFGRFVPAREVAGLLASTPAGRLEPGNGSNLDVGAALAAQLLAREGGTGRMLLFTDERLRTGFSNAATITALAGVNDLVVHVLARTESNWGSLNERRDDDAELAPIATSTGGIFSRVRGEPTEPEAAAKVMLNLVRPVRVEDFKVEGPGLPELSVESELNEGSMVRLQGIEATPPQSLTVSGKVWAREFRREVTVDPSLAARLPGIAVGDEDLRLGLSDDELRTAAFLSHAVSPVTSFMFVSPGAGPSTAGLSEPFGVGHLGRRGLASCYSGGSSRCGFGSAGPVVDFEALLRQLLSSGTAACEAHTGEAATATVRLEATGDEVVAVTVKGATPAMSECLTEATWAIRLSSEFHTTRTYSVELISSAARPR
ncbi:MAG: hypothetical protein Q8N26_09380 [Myxococcales bacterium]|nr:hypothetical protein [Myxococcales bacterium]